MRIEALMFAAVSLILMGCACSKWDHEQPVSTQQEQSTTGDVPPVVRIEASPTIELGSRLAIAWKISNAGPKPIYVYSTQLQNAASAEFVIDAERRMIDVHCLRLQPISVGINAFPEAEFMQVNSKELKEGKFVSYAPIDKLISYKATTKAEKVTPGVWRIQLSIAYGYEIESVRKALSESLRHGTEHPINPIVRWQKVAYSEPIVVDFRK